MASSVDGENVGRQDWGKWILICRKKGKVLGSVKEKWEQRKLGSRATM
jgi:hypothetical protein